MKIIDFPKCWHPDGHDVECHFSPYPDYESCDISLWKCKRCDLAWVVVHQNNYQFLKSVMKNSPYLKGRYLWQGENTFKNPVELKK